MIEVEHLNKVYGSTVALSDVHFSVEAGEILGFLGPNGAGKTTTMRILAGYIRATSGTARIAGYDVHQESMQVRRHIGYLPENPPLYLDMTVEGYLHFVANIKGVAAGERKTAVQKALQRCQIKDKAKVLINKLSKGMRQRVGLAQAIVHSPPVIILDEPTVGLDPQQIIEVRHLIKSLAGDVTIILSSHILPEVSMICDRVTIINQGSVVTTNTPAHLMSQLVSTTIYTLEVGGNILLIMPLLEVLDGVANLELISQDLESDSRFILQITASDNREDLGKNLAQIVVTSGLSLYEMRKTRPTLEEVFLQLTTTESIIIEEK